MTRKKSGKSKRAKDDDQTPAPETIPLADADLDSRAEAETARFSETGPALTAGDADADWKRAASAGEEAPGGTVPTPDQDVVDEIGRALGVPRGTDEEVRTSQEILEERDRHRWEQDE
jgi:hypothetical protein